jgi:ribonucleoside-triphosphate reductase
MRLKNLLLGIHTKNKLSNISTSFFKSYNQKSNLYSFTCKKYNSPSSYQNLHFSSINSYKLDDEFVNLYKDKVVNFGFNGLGELVYRRTYSRIKDDGTNEQWWETVRRVVEGTFNMLVDHINENHIRTTDDFKAEIKKDSMVMFDKIFNFKFLPPGRGLWSMGTNITEKKKIYAALNNCAFVSTKPVDRSNIDDIVKPYAFLMDCAMLGVGVGFDTKASSMNIKIFPLNKEHHKHYIVEDSREGWVESLKVLLKSFFQEDQYQVVFDYSQLRAAGKPLKIFGGVSAGPQPLIDLHRNISKLLENNAGKKLSSRVIVDIMNYIGKSVVAGNISKKLL